MLWACKYILLDIANQVNVKVLHNEQCSIDFVFIVATFEKGVFHKAMLVYSRVPDMVRN